MKPYSLSQTALLPLPASHVALKAATRAVFTSGKPPTVRSIASDPKTSVNTATAEHVTAIRFGKAGLPIRAA